MAKAPLQNISHGGVQCRQVTKMHLLSSLTCICAFTRKLLRRMMETAIGRALETSSSHASHLKVETMGFSAVPHSYELLRPIACWQRGGVPFGHCGAKAKSMPKWKKKNKEREEERSQEEPLVLKCISRFSGSLVATKVCGAFLPLTSRWVACSKDSKNAMLCRCLYVWVDFSGGRHGL